MKLTRLLGIFLVSTVAGACADLDDRGNHSQAVAPGQDRVIVKWKDGPQAKGLIANSGGSIELDLPRHGAFAARVPAAALNGLRNHPAIEFIEPDVKRYPLAVDPVTPYGITMVQADVVSDAAAGNRTVCIIDSGYSRAHPDLSAASNVSGTNDPGTGNWYEDFSHHGTHVAGTISAMNNDIGVVGVLPNSNINLHIVKVFGDTGDWAYSSTLIAALDVCEDAGANVVSMSLGGPSGSKKEQRAFDGAYGRGVLSIAAAGNDGDTSYSYPASYASVVSVAAVDASKNIADFSQQNSQVELAGPGVGILSTVPVGAGRDSSVNVDGVDYACDPMDGTAVGNVSAALVDCGVGGSPCVGVSGKVCLIARGDYAFSDKVLNCEAGGGAAAIIYNNEPGALLGTLGDVIANIPAVGVSDSTGATLMGLLGSSAAVAVEASDYAYYDGTSMATPHVSAVAALVWSYDPSWTAAEIRAALAASAEDLGTVGRDVAYGYGLVQAQAALDYLGGSAPPVCTPTEDVEVSCADGVDNDCDGDIDDADSDCGGSVCVPTEDVEVSCEDDADNDCDGDIDGDDSDCADGSCEPAGASCSGAEECCSNKCVGKPGSRTCK